MTGGVALEWSHHRVRTTTRADEVPALPAVEAAPMNDPVTGRFVPRNRAYRRRQLKARAEGIATLNPATAPSWMRPHIDQGRSYVLALLAMLEGKPALHPLAGDCADAHTLYRALLALALATESAEERASLLTEARGWLKEHRTALATLSKLAGDLRLPGPSVHPLEAIRARLAATAPPCPRCGGTRRDPEHAGPCGECCPPAPGAPAKETTP
jgi:hypothetical protein